MKKTFKLIPILLIAAMVIILPSCKEKENIIPTVQPTTGEMEVRFDYVFGANALPWELGKTFVHPKTGDTLTFTLFRFYVSNIKLKKEDGSWWVHPNSYFLLDAKSTSESTMLLKDVPNGSYTEMEYTMGVDSLMNVSGAHEGALSFTNAMFWDWNSGYIMLKAEGNSPNSPSNTFALHLGGFSGTTNVVTTNNTGFSGEKLHINSSKRGVIKLTANTARLWHSAPGVDSVNIIHAPGAVAKTMAKDFYSGIIFSGLE